MSNDISNIFAVKLIFTLAHGPEQQSEKKLRFKFVEIRGNECNAYKYTCMFVYSCTRHAK